MQLQKLDTRDPATSSDEFVCITGVRDQVSQLPYFLNYYRDLGVDRFYFMDNGSVDGTTEYLLDQLDCHCFHAEGSHFENNIWPPRWSNAVLNVYGTDRWCVVVDSDELLIYPEIETTSLKKICGFLDRTGSNAMSACMIDMYGSGAIAKQSYVEGNSFVETTPYFDPEPGWVRPFNGYPPLQMFGGVRERVFWKGRFRKTLPPCISKVPLVRWQRGMRYTVAQHIINQAKLSSVTGALLHFKFLTGFEQTTLEQVDENRELKEKTLEEREAYLEALRVNPKLKLFNENSVRYKDSRQLVDLGWTSSSDRYEQFLNQQS